MNNHTRKATNHNPLDTNTHTPNIESLDSTRECYSLDYIIEVGKIGKTIGLQGAVVFHLTGDFITFIQVGTTLFSDKLQCLLTIQSITKRHNNMLLSFSGIDSVEQAKRLVNTRLLTNEQETRAKCLLKNDEFFYFDIIGLQVIEDNEVLGVVTDIERIGTIDYLLITRQEAQTVPTINYAKQEKTTKKSKKHPSFYVPYIDAYVLHIVISTPGQSGGVFTQNAKMLCE